MLMLSAGTIWADSNPFQVEGRQAFWTKTSEVVKHHFEGTVLAESNSFQIKGRKALWSKNIEVTKYYFEMGQDHKECLIKHGAVIIPEMIGDEGRVFFLEKGEYFFFKIEDLTDDPRETERWEIYRETSQAKTLWKMVSEAADTESYPALTQKILDDMVRAKIITPKEQQRKMEPAQLREIMLRYSELVWD